MTLWIEYDPFEELAFPKQAAVYVFQVSGKTLYVGSTSNLQGRMASYGFRYMWGGGAMTPWGQFAYEADHPRLKARFSRRIGDFAMWELRLIHRIQPRFNIRGVATMKLKTVA